MYSKRNYSKLEASLKGLSKLSDGIDTDAGLKDFRARYADFHSEYKFVKGLLEGALKGVDKLKERSSWLYDDLHNNFFEYTLDNRIVKFKRIKPEKLREHDIIRTVDKDGIIHLREVFNVDSRDVGGYYCTGDVELAYGELGRELVDRLLEIIGKEVSFDRVACQDLLREYYRTRVNTYKSDGHTPKFISLKLDRRIEVIRMVCVKGKK